MEIRIRERAHGTPAFPVDSYCRCYLNDQPFLYHSHLHDEFEFFYLASGEADVYVNGTPFALGGGDSLLILSSALHFAKRTKPLPCDTIALLCHPDFLLGRREEDAINTRYLAPLLSPEHPSALYLPADFPGQHHVARLFRAVSEALAEPKPGGELLIKAYLMELLYAFLTTPGGKTGVTGAASALNPVKKSLQYIQAHFQQDISLEELAAHVHMSPGQFGRLFRRMMAQPPITYLVQYRVQHSALLLQETRMKVSDIALQVGFRNFSYYNKCFRQFFGMTPSEYRAQFRART